MKAESAIMTGAQLPLTWFGLPPSLFIATAAVSAVTLGVTIAVGLMAFSLPVTVVVFAVTWTKFHRNTRRDPHAANYMRIAPRFWKKRTSRILIAGDPPADKKGEKR